MRSSGSLPLPNIPRWEKEEPSSLSTHHLKLEPLLYTSHVGSSEVSTLQRCLIPHKDRDLKAHRMAWSQKRLVLAH